jgi:hypothetical protein
MSGFDDEPAVATRKKQTRFDTDDDTLTLHEHSETRHIGSESDFTQLS